MGWEFSAGHSHVEWAVKYLTVSIVRGRFRNVHVTLDFESEDPTDWSVDAVIDAASLDSTNEQRDDIVRGPEYLDVERFPTIMFKSKRVERGNDGYRVIGDLTLHGIVREVALDAQYHGDIRDARGIRRRGFTAVASVRRSDFDIHTSPDVDPLTNAAGEEIQITIEAQAVRRD